jgi:hypothetical protein
MTTAPILLASKLLATARPAPDRRAELVTWLARAERDMPPEVVIVLLDWLAADHLRGKALDDAWHRFKDEVALTEAAREGRLDWCCAYLDLTCAGVVSQRDAEAAIRALEAQVEQARTPVIASGKRTAES